MKRIMSFLIALLLSVYSSGIAKAVEVTVAGEWDFAFGWAKNTSFYGYNSPNGINEDSFNARHRVRTQMDMVISEQLRAVVQFEIGNLNWGQDVNGKFGSESGGGLGGDGVNTETRQAYLEWKIPGSEALLRMGLQHLTLPSGTNIGSPILGNDVAGISMHLPLSELVGLTAFWARPFDLDTIDGAQNVADEMDMFALTLPVTGQGFAITPWIMYASIGSGSGAFEFVTGEDASAPLFGDGDRADAFWVGLALNAELMESLSFGTDVIYGRSDRVGTYFATDGFKTSGWFIDANLNYALEWGTPGLFAWWSSGDTESGYNEDKGGRLLSVNDDYGFAATSFGLPGTVGIGHDSIYSTTGLGTWGVGAQIAGISFVEDLQHTIRLAYYQGTNDSDIVKNGYTPILYSLESIYLTDKDSVWEVNFDHSWQIYENLTAYIETAYIHMDLDELGTPGRSDTSDAWKAQLLFQLLF